MEYPHAISPSSLDRRPCGRGKLAWTDDDLLVGVRVIHAGTDLKRLVNRWVDGEFDVG